MVLEKISNLNHDRIKYPHACLEPQSKTSRTEYLLVTWAVNLYLTGDDQ